MLATTFGGNVIRAHPLYKIDFDATKPFDRAKLCDALKAEFQLLVEEEELPDTIGGLDAFCYKIVREPKIRDLTRHEIYRA